jgi:HK97 gp10 family phage protein
MSFTLEGVAALTKQLEALGSLEDGKALKRAVKSGINEALKEAKQIIPVGKEPHRLSNGLLVNYGYAKSQLRTISTINSAKNVASGILGVRKLAYYILQFIELGTRKTPAQPWIRRALLQSRDQAELALRNSLQVSIAKAIKAK